MMLTYGLFLPSFCLLISFCSALNLPPGGYDLEKRQLTLPDYAQRNLNTIRRIYNLTVYPNNAPIVAKGAEAVPPGLLYACHQPRRGSE